MIQRILEYKAVKERAIVRTLILFAFVLGAGVLFTIALEYLLVILAVILNTFL